MDNPQGYYKARITYKNPEWKDGEENEDLEYFMTFDITINPPPDKSGMLPQHQHMMAQQALIGFWSGNLPVQPESDFFIHPNRIISIQILENIVVATVSKQVVAQAIASTAK